MAHRRCTSGPRRIKQEDAWTKILLLGSCLLILECCGEAIDSSFGLQVPLLVQKLVPHLLVLSVNQYNTTSHNISVDPKSSMLTGDVVDDFKKHMRHHLPCLRCSFDGLLQILHRKIDAIGFPLLARHHLNKPFSRHTNKARKQSPGVPYQNNSEAHLVPDKDLEDGLLLRYVGVGQNHLAD